MVEEPSVMSEFGIVTRPMSETRKKEVVAEPLALVELAISKSAPWEAKVPWIESLANGDEVPKTPEPETY